MKGFNTSTDYLKLWDLINDGYRIPGWILYSEKTEEPIFDLVEVKMIASNKFPFIGTRGRGLNSLSNTKEAFMNDCKCLSLFFIIPKTDS